MVRRFLGQICDLSNQFSEEIVELLFTAFNETPSVLQFISYLSYVGSSKGWSNWFSTEGELRFNGYFKRAITQKVRTMLRCRNLK